MYLSAAGLVKRCAWLEIPGPFLACVRIPQLVKSRRPRQSCMLRSGTIVPKAGRECDQIVLDRMADCNNGIDKGVGWY